MVIIIIIFVIIIIIIIIIISYHYCPFWICSLSELTKLHDDSQEKNLLKFYMFEEDSYLIVWSKCLTSLIISL